MIPIYRSMILNFYNLIVLKVLHTVITRGVQLIYFSEKIKLNKPGFKMLITYVAIASPKKNI